MLTDAPRELTVSLRPVSEPYQGPDLSMQDVFRETEVDKDRRGEYQKGLLHSVYGLKTFISSIGEDFKGLKMRPGAAAQIRANIDKKRQETVRLIEEVRGSFAQVERHLREELGALRMELAEAREGIQEIVGFDDFVRGFDGEAVTDDNIDFLDIYQQFLG